MKFYSILLLLFFIVFSVTIAKSQPIEPTLPFKGYANSTKEKEILEILHSYKKDNSKALKFLVSQKKYFSNELIFHRNYAEILFLQEKERVLLNYLTALIDSVSKDNQTDRVRIIQYMALRGIFLYRLNYKNSAFQDLSKAYQFKYTNLEFLLYLHRLLEERKANKNLIYRVIKEALKKDKRNHRLWFEKARVESLENRPQEAYDSIQTALLLREEPLYFELELALDKIYKPHLYSSNLTAVIEKYPQIFIFQVLYYQVAKKGNYLVEFTKFLKQRIQSFSSSSNKNLAQFYSLLAQAQFGLKQKDEAVQSYQKSLTLFPSLSTKVYLARLLWELDRKKESVSYLIEAASKNYADFFIYRTLAQYYSSLGLYLTAEQYILQGLEFYPQDTFLLLEYALLSEKTGQHEEAIKAVKELLKIQRDTGFLNHLGRLLTLIGDYSQADQYLRESLKIKESSIPRYYLALNAYYQENFSEALQHLEKIKEGKNSFYEFYTLAASINFHQKKFEKALFYIDKYISVNEKSNRQKIDSIVKTIKIESLLYLGKWDLAAENIAIYGEEDPFNFYYKQQMIILLFLRGDRKVEEKIEEYLNNFQPNIRMIEILYYLKKGKNYLWKFSDEKDVALYEKKIFDQFLSILDRLDNTNFSNNEKNFLKYSWAIEQETTIDLFKKAPSNTFWSEYILGVDSFRNQDYEKSSLLLNSALEKEKAPWGYFLLGKLFEIQKNYSAASDAYKTFLSAYPNNGEGLERLAIAYDLNKQPSLSEKIYHKILKRNPNNATALNNLSWLYLTKKQSPKNTKKALELAKKAVSLRRVSAHLDTLAEAYFQNQKYQKAIEFIEQAVALDRNNLDHFKLQRNKFLEEIVKSK